ncbi:MAG: hypothetical protein E7294_12685 [Lachnospiraceae bacterium]|nr:hypothetical protein [Lachnospiraceae bacterium]
MDILKPLAVVGTNSWGSAVYGKVLRGESVDIDTIRKCYDRAKERDLLIFDLAQDYGLGKAQKMIGEFGTDDVIICCPVFGILFGNLLNLISEGLDSGTESLGWFMLYLVCAPTLTDKKR